MVPQEGEGGVPFQFHQMEGAPPFSFKIRRNYKKRKKVEERLQIEENQIRREIGNEVFLRRKRGRSKESEKAKSSCLVSFLAIRLVWDLNPQCCLLQGMVKCYRGVGGGWRSKRRREWGRARTSLLSQLTSTSTVKYSSQCLVHNF